MKKSSFFPYIILICALSVSGSAAFYSIYGLSKLFAGAYIPVIIMATTLEVSKLIIAATLHNYWKVLSFIWKLYLIPALFALMIITSAGIYGFLSNAYQITYNKDLQITKQIELIQIKQHNFEDRKLELVTEKKGIISGIEGLRSALGSNIQQSVDRKTGVIVKSSSNSNRKTFENQLSEAISRRNVVDNTIAAYQDSILSLETKIAEINSSSSVASELGPLKYLSKLTGNSMDIVVNWFLLLLIGVFDPLAIILMVLALRVRKGGLGNTMPSGEVSPDNVPVQPALNPVISQSNTINDTVSTPVNTTQLTEPKQLIIHKTEPEKISKTRMFIDNLNTMPQRLTDNLKSMLASKNEKPAKPDLTDSQKKIMTHQEIREFYEKSAK